MKCVVCLEGPKRRPGSHICRECATSFEMRGLRMETMEWAAKRARAFERKRAKAESPSIDWRKAARAALKHLEATHSNDGSDWADSEAANAGDALEAALGLPRMVAKRQKAGKK